MPARRSAGVSARHRTMSGATAPLCWVPPRRPRAVWLVSLLIHAVLVFMWLQQPKPSRTRPVSRMELRIVPMAPGPKRSAVETAPLPPTDPRSAGTRDLRDPERRPTPPAAVSVPIQSTATDPAPSETPAPAMAATAGPQPITAALPSAQPSTPAPSPSPGGLRLDWNPPPRSARAASAPTVREQALNDARSNTQRPAPEARMAQNVGDDSLREEALGDARRRFRKGAACVDVHRTHIAQLNPFDARLRDIQVAKPCD